MFALQYRHSKGHRHWLSWSAPSTLQYDDLEHVSDGVRLFGDWDDEDLEVLDNEDEVEEDVVHRTKLEVGPGLRSGTAVGRLLLADM